MFGAVHEYIVRYQLAVIFVRSHHIGSDALFARFGGKGADHIIGLIAGNFQDGDAVSADDILYDRYGQTDGFWCLFPLCFILFVGFVTEGRARRIKGHSDM